MKLEDIGFYTLSDHRTEQISSDSPMWRCEMILTDRCNFKCPYCRGLRQDCRGDIALCDGVSVLDNWISDGLKNIRFSGGEPTVHKNLLNFVKRCKFGNVERIAVSSNGSAPLEKYLELEYYGVNDFSISLDACCSEDVDKMTGKSGFYGRIIENIKILSERSYVTIGCVLTEHNIEHVEKIIIFAHELGVSDVRIIPAAQYQKGLKKVNVSERILAKFPILKYRLDNVNKGGSVRGLKETDSNRCHLIQDDSIVAGDYHFPCVIYMREGGEPIGKVSRNMRDDRIAFFNSFNTHNNVICKNNCLDVCVEFNNKCGYKSSYIHN